MKKIVILFILLFIISCKPNLDYELHGYTQKIIVEGYIGAGEFPQVYLTLNCPFYERIDSSNIINKVIRTAKVTVCDGENSEILTSEWETTHFPPYVYRGTTLKGEVGKTYNLQIDYGGYTIYATTTIPYASEVSDFSMSPVQNQTEMRILYMNLDIINQKNGFRVFTKKTNSSDYVESPFVYNENLNLSGKHKFTIVPKPNETDPNYYESGYFRVNTDVLVKVISIDSVSTQFFKSLTMFSSNGLGQNVFIGENESLPSNITSPGFGIWYGYNKRIYLVSIK